MLAISSIINLAPVLQSESTLKTQLDVKAEATTNETVNNNDLKNAILAYTLQSNEAKDTKKDETTIPSKDVIKAILEEFKYGTNPTTDKESKILGGNMAKYAKGVFMDTNDGNRIYFKWIRNEKQKIIGIIYHVEKLDKVEKNQENYESLKDMLDYLKKRYHMKDELIINSDETKTEEKTSKK